MPCSDRDSPLRKFDTGVWMRAVPGILDPFLTRNGGKIVPPEFWGLEDADEEECKVATISCPCGVEPPPIVGIGNFSICKGEDCRRVYFFMGDELRAMRLTEEQVSYMAELDQPEAQQPVDLVN